MNMEVELLNIEQELNCDCCTTHAQNALLAYHNGNDSLIRSIFYFNSCEEVAEQEVGMGLKYSCIYIHFDNLRACDFKFLDSLKRVLLDVVKPDVEKKWNDCLKVIDDLNYISKNKVKWNRSNFQHNCYSFYAENILRRKYRELNEDISFLRVHDSSFAQKFDSIHKIIRNHENYDSLMNYFNFADR